MMYNENLRVKAVTLPDNMAIENQKSDARLAIIIRNEQGEMLSQGQVGYYGDFVVYDCSHTAENARRQGYVSMVINLLTQDAKERGISKGLLCASEQGQYLYQVLGWQTIGHYCRLVRKDYVRK